MPFKSDVLGGDCLIFFVLLHFDSFLLQISGQSILFFSEFLSEVPAREARAKPLGIFLWAPEIPESGHLSFSSLTKSHNIVISLSNPTS